MSFIKNNIKSSSERGFTIVELLIVIVVIGILAAITIVSFNGVTARANTTSAKAAASSVLKKAEAYNADETTSTTGYPATLSLLLTTAAQSTPYGVSGVSAHPADNTVAPTKPSVIKFFRCAANTGTKVSYWDYTTSAWVDLTTGTCSTAFTFSAS